MTCRIHVGVSGFSYPKWRGKFYPKEATAEDFLAFYSERLNTVEINSSFYAAPRTTVIQGWFQKSRREFTFSMKAPGQVTHVLKLGKGAAQLAQRFFSSLETLKNKRGPILFQLPPYSKLDLKLLEGFLDETSAINGRVFEFRHPSWFQGATYTLLESNGAAFCIAETQDLDPTFKMTGEPAYFRLRLDSYSEDEIDAWARKIAEIARGSKECYVYLRHDETGENALLSQRLAGRLTA